MITKELVKAEIDHIPMKDVETVYKLIRVFTLSTDDLLNAAEKKPMPDIGDAKQRFSFIGIGHSGKRHLSTQVEEILAQAVSER